MASNLGKEPSLRQHGTQRCFSTYNGRVLHAMTCMKCGKGTEYVVVFRNQYGLLNLNYCDEHFTEYCKEIAEAKKA